MVEMHSSWFITMLISRELTRFYYTIWQITRDGKKLLEIRLCSRPIDDHFRMELEQATENGHALVDISYGSDRSWNCELKCANIAKKWESENDLNSSMIHSDGSIWSIAYPHCDEQSTYLVFSIVESGIPQIMNTFKGYTKLIGNLLTMTDSAHT